MGLYSIPLLLVLVISGWARDLHQTRVVIVEKDLPQPSNDGVIVSRTEEEERLFPDYMALEVHADGERVALLMLQRSADLDQGFPIVSADGDFDTIPAQRMTDAAMYRDLSSSAAFGVKRDENGNRVYEGTFIVDGESYFMNNEHDNKRSSEEYMMTRVEKMPFTDDALKVSQEKMERVNPKLTTRANNYNVEIGVLVDYSEYKFWLDREGSKNAALNRVYYKMTYNLNAMRMSYQTVTGMTITPYITKLAVNTDSSKSMIENPNQLFTNTAKKYLEKWSAQATNYGMAAGSDVDIGMFWAKYDFCGEKNCDTIGLAYVGGVCSAVYGYNIIEDTGFGNSWQTAAHELAHNLGSDHDGDDNDCNPDDHYVMSPSAGWPAVGSGNTGYDFSSCSIKYMADELASKTCLSNGASDNFNKVNGGLPGQVFTVDEQCQFMHGSVSAECSTDFKPVDATRCTGGIWCKHPQNPSRSCTILQTRPWDGTPCGGGKHCSNGKCE